MRVPDRTAFDRPWLQRGTISREVVFDIVGVLERIDELAPW